ncbi:MAG: hypothetical protein JZU65_19570, partial [Chlorobium sp.]|nr:hypothetical protein [Chlorobium sp.]
IAGAQILPDGNILSWAGDIRIWDSNNYECIFKKENSHTATKVFCLPDGRLLSWSENDEDISIWNRHTGEIDSVLRHKDRVAGVNMSPNGRLLSWTDSEGDENYLRVWNISSGKCLKKLKHGGLYGADGAVFLSDGRILSWDFINLYLWDGKNGKFLKKIETNFPISRVLQISDVKILVWRTYYGVDALLENNVMQVWDIETGECKLTLKGHTISVIDAVMMQNNNILSWSKDTTLRIWNSITGDCIATLNGHTDPIDGVRILKDGRILSWAAEGFSSADFMLRIWDGTSGKCCCQLNGHSQWVTGAVVLANDMIVSCSADKSIRIWDSQSIEPIEDLECHSTKIKGTLLLPQGRLLTWAGKEPIKEWDIQTGNCLRQLGGHTDKISNVLLLSENRLLSWASDKMVRIWDLESGRCLTTFTEHEHEARIKGAIELPNKRILSWSTSYTQISLGDTLCVWNSETGVCESKLSAEGAIFVSNLLVDGRILAVLVGNYFMDGRVKIWDSQNGLVTMEKDASYFSDVCFLPDGRVISSRYSNENWIWDSRNGKLLLHLKSNKDGICKKAALLSDGRILGYVESNISSSINIWDGKTGELLTAIDGTFIALSSEEHVISFDKSTNSICIWSSYGELLAEYYKEKAFDAPEEIRQQYLFKSVCTTPTAGLSCSDNSAVLAHKNSTTINHYYWQGDSTVVAHRLFPDGRAVVTQDNGQVCFLQAYQGNQQIELN